MNNDKKTTLFGLIQAILVFVTVMVGFFFPQVVLPDGLAAQIQGADGTSQLLIVIVTTIYSVVTATKGWLTNKPDKPATP